MPKPRDLKAGDSFPSPRAEEGTVRAVCDFGKCVHGDDRPDSVHVSSATHGTQFFIALIDWVELHICSEDQGCWDLNRSGRAREEHRHANRSQQ